MKNSPKESIFALANQLRQSVEHWQYLYKHGASDPDQGVYTDLVFESKNPNFGGIINVHVWDHEYVVIS